WVLPEHVQIEERPRLPVGGRSHAAPQRVPTRVRRPVVTVALPFAVDTETRLPSSTARQRNVERPAAAPEAAGVCAGVRLLRRTRLMDDVNDADERRRAVRDRRWPPQDLNPLDVLKAEHR